MTTLSASDRAKGWVQAAADAFERAAAGADIVLETARGIGYAMQAIEAHPDLRALAPDLADTIPRTLFGLTLRLAEDLDGTISTDRVAAGLAATAGLFSVGNDGLAFDRWSHAGVFAAELTAVWHRRNLARRGDPFTRALAIRRAMATSRAPGDPTH